MNWNSSLHKNMLHAGICILLCAAIVLGMLVPGADLTRAVPGNPLENEAIREISVLKVGENLSQMESIAAPNEGSEAPTEPEEMEDQETEPEENEPEITEPEETKPQETTPQQTDPSNPEDGEEDEGNDEGNQGEEGGEELELELAAVMTWYKYGTDPNTIACAPSGTASKTINTAQLINNELKYAFTLTGADAGFVDITGVAVAAGDSEFAEVAQNGSLEIKLPEGNGVRNYTFQLTGFIEKPGENGEIVQQELTFSFVLKCEHTLDLELELTWQPVGGNKRSILCGADKTESFSVKSYDLTERVFAYSVQLTGTLAENAQIVSAEYTTASGQISGELNTDSGSLVLTPEPGKDTEAYHLTFTVKTPQREVTYRYKLMYREALDVQLNFHWMEKGAIRRTKTCEADDQVTEQVKKNQLSGGAIPYEMELAGADSADGQILSVTYTATGSSGNLEASGYLPMSMPAGASANTYHITVIAMVKGQRLNFEIVLQYSADVSLQMDYTVSENGVVTTRQVICENAGSKTAEAIYDDQLTDGILQYKLSFAGSEASSLTITSVTCYQSGSKRTVNLSSQGQLTLLLKDGKTGENTFEIKAQDAGGNTYRFTINIPYKHRGENNIKIETNLRDGQQITNEAKTNLTVRAWSEDGNGNVLSYIPANGTQTKLIVTFDGEQLSYTSSSGANSEYDLYPKNPETGDDNTHVLNIYAEDAFGNFGELTLNLIGQRSEAGQVIGKATIKVDMTALGLGVVATTDYDVMAKEPVSYVVAKAVMGKDTGVPFGAAANTLGWGGRYAGTLDIGFYLESLTPTIGLGPKVLEAGSWPGSTEAETLQAIDARFGAGTGLATLWRCIYRNSVRKSAGSGNSYGEFDYTLGAGWMFSVGGSTYYPGQSMSNVYLQPGDVLTLRFTLAYGWDVSGGSSSIYGNNVGYCVRAINGGFNINHQMETVTNPDGSIANVCHCCGIVEDCLHTHCTYMEKEDGMHIGFCEDCQKEIGDPELHIWEYVEDPELEAQDQHRCNACGAVETHRWEEVEGSNTATCTKPGKHSVLCERCNHSKEEDVDPKGHQTGNQWQHPKEEHYQLCTDENCDAEGEKLLQGNHQYVYITYMENGGQKEDYDCRICHVIHGDVCQGTLSQVQATCQRITQSCNSCGYEMVKEGFFEEHHFYGENGTCIYGCGTANMPTDPTPTDPAPTDPAPTDPAPTDPAPTDPAPTDPAPTDPAPTDPVPTDPAPTDPAPTDPVPTDPAPTDPVPTDPAPTDPAPTDPVPTDPAPTDPAPIDPVPEQPVDSGGEETA